MLYRDTNTGKTFTSYTAFCDYMASMYPELRYYYQEERRKCIRKQERSLPFFIIFLILGLIGMFISMCA